MSFRCLPEATNNSSNGKRYSSETKMLFFFFLGAADTAPNISELLIRYFKTCWMVPIQDEVAADCRQALVFLTLQQWHMMRVSPFPDRRMADENPWFQASPFPDGWKILGVLTSIPRPRPPQRVGDTWRRCPTPWAAHRCAMESTIRTKILAGAGMVCISTIAAWLYPWMCE